MVESNIINLPVDVINQIGSIGLWLKSIGAIVIAWIVFQIVNFIINRKRIKEVYKIKRDMKRIENKINLILGNTSKNRS